MLVACGGVHLHASRVFLFCLAYAPAGGEGVFPRKPNSGEGPTEPHVSDAGTNMDTGNRRGFSTSATAARFSAATTATATPTSHLLQLGAPAHTSGAAGILCRLIQGRQYNRQYNGQYWDGSTMYRSMGTSAVGGADPPSGYKGTERAGYSSEPVTGVDAKSEGGCGKSDRGSGSSEYLTDYATNPGDGQLGGSGGGGQGDDDTQTYDKKSDKGGGKSERGGDGGYLGDEGAASTGAFASASDFDGAKSGASSGGLKPAGGCITL